MKKLKPILFAFAASAMLIFFICCNKSGNAGSNNFTWTFGGVTYIATLDSAYINYPLISYYIVAITGTNFNTNFNQKVGFGLTSFNTGSFSIGSGGNTLHYIDAKHKITMEYPAH